MLQGFVIGMASAAWLQYMPQPLSSKDSPVLNAKTLRHCICSSVGPVNMLTCHFALVLQAFAAASDAR